MFDNFSGKISSIFDKLSGRKYLSEEDLNVALREIRVALLEADVSLSIAKEFINKIKSEALGQEVTRSVSPGQMVVKIVNDHLIELLGSEKSEIDFKSNPPLVILMVGLQASGKTTSSAKLALRLKKKNNKKVLLSSLDIYRPAAAEQLKILADRIEVEVADFDGSKKPVELAKEAKMKAVQGGFDVLILDSAGRTAIDSAMMQELVDINKAVTAGEILLVVDSMIGQDAINVAKNFQEKLELGGIILTRLDGDSRGGAALTMKAATGCPIKFIGVGEKIDEFEEFNPDRIASRIIGMGDVVSLVEKAQDAFDEKEAEKATKKFRQGKFDFNDLLSQIRNMKKMGGITKILGFIPGASGLKEKLGSDPKIEKEFKLQEALILSMTKSERSKPDILNSSRKHRIAKGAGSNIQEVNRLLKKYKQMHKMMQKIQKRDPRELEAMLEQNKGAVPDLSQLSNLLK